MAGRPRILFVTPSAYTLSGLASWLDTMEPGLEARGWEVIIGLVEGARHHHPQRYLAVHPHRRWKEVHCLSGTVEGRRQALERVLLRVEPQVAAAVNIPDLFPAVNALRRTGRAPGLRAVMTVHGIHPFLYADLRRYRQVVDGAVCSNRLASRLATVRGGLDPARVYYAPYGVPKGPPRREAGGGPLRIGWVGRLEPEKRPLDLVGIVTALRREAQPFELTVVGTGTQESELRQRLEVARGDVIFMGVVDPEAVRRRVLPGFDALLITSMWETGPIVAWEAMTAGVPVVSSRYLGSAFERALLDGNTALLFDVGDVEGAARALRRLAVEPSLSTRLAAAGRQLQQERYSSEASVTAWNAGLRSILGLAPKPHDPTLGPHPAGEPNARLSRRLPEGVAEWVRRLLRRKGPDGGPGGEWPSTHAAAIEEADYLAEVAAIERAEAPRAVRVER